jgi:hypothetical protein
VIKVGFLQSHSMNFPTFENKQFIINKPKIIISQYIYKLKLLIFIESKKKNIQNKIIFLHKLIFISKKKKFTSF